MKKKTKKLVLAKETVRNLAGVNLDRVAGGSWFTCGEQTCGCPTGGTCECTDSNGPHNCPGDPPSADTRCA